MGNYVYFTICRGDIRGNIRGNIKNIVLSGILQRSAQLMLFTSVAIIAIKFKINNKII